MEVVHMFLGGLEGIIGTFLAIVVIALIAKFLWGKVSEDKGREVGEELQDAKNFGKGLQEGWSGDGKKETDGEKERRKQEMSEMRKEISELKEKTNDQGKDK